MILFLAVAVILFLQTLRADAQTASPFWRKPNITISTADRISLAAAALDNAIDRLSADGQFDGEPWGTTGNLFSQMAEFDIATNQTKYENAVLQSFELVEKIPGRVNFSDTYSFGHAAARAYTAYKNPKFLGYAVQSWWDGRARTLSENDISAGKIAGKNFSIAGVCGNATMVGGTFWANATMEPSISGIGTGYFLALSGLLAEATTDPMYLQAAVESADFIHSHLYNIGNIVQDYISAGFVNNTDCQVISTTTPTNTGLMIEGLAILASITNDTSTLQRLGDTLLAVIPDTSWQGENGVVTTPTGVGDMNLIQGLGAAYMRNSINNTLRQYVGDYIAVQFNAVVDLATSSGTNIYGASWTGPPSAKFSGTNQTIALGALISAIGLSSNATATTSLPGTSPTSPSGNAPIPNPSRHSLKPGPIIGGVIGGVTITAIFALWLLRRHRSRAPTNSSPQNALLEPFMASAINPSISPPNISQIQKRNPNRNPPTSSGIIHSAAVGGEGSGQINSPAAIDAEFNHNPESALPTEALVRLLNQRLRNRQWNDGETPPDYPVTG